MKKILFFSLLFVYYLCSASIYGDCFQEVAGRWAPIFIDGIDPNNLLADEANVGRLIIAELETCMGLSGVDLYERVRENAYLLGCEKYGMPGEIFVCALALKYFPLNMAVRTKVAVLQWYDSEGKLKDDYYQNISCETVENDSLSCDMSIQKQLLDSEPNTDTHLALALLDYMFTRSPKQALVLLNESLSSEEKDILKETIFPLVKLHSWRDPRSWKDENLSTEKALMNQLILSNYAYIDLFLAEIINIVHDLRTPEVETFLTSKTHPLIQKRLNNPFIYVPLSEQSK